MSMSASGGAAHAVSEINVTPLIDVLLVLLIIFMVIVPVAPKGLDARISKPAKGDGADPPATIVVEVQGNSSGDLTYSINQKVFAKSDVESQLAAIFAKRQDKTMFVRAGSGLEFSTVAEVVDMGHLAAAENIGLLTPHGASGE